MNGPSTSTDRNVNVFPATVVGNNWLSTTEDDDNVSNCSGVSGEAFNTDKAVLNFGTVGTVTHGNITTFNGQVIINYGNVDGRKSLTNEDKGSTDKKAGAAPTPRRRRDADSDASRRTRIVVLCGVVLVATTAVAAYFSLRSQDDTATSTSETSKPTTRTPTTTTPTTPSDAPPPISTFIYKEQWGGRPPLYEVNLTLPVSLVIVKHTAGSFCSDFTQCSETMRNIQSQHVGNGAPDIWYNFLIGGDGNIYVGRGWYAENENSKNAIDIAFVGNFTPGHDELSSIMDRAGQKILIVGASKSFLQNFKVVNHNQTTTTDSPGENAYKVVTKWYQYSPIVYKVYKDP